DDALTERDRAGNLPDDVADDGHDGRLHGVHASTGSHGLGHTCFLPQSTLSAPRFFWIDFSAISAVSAVNVITWPQQSACSSPAERSTRNITNSPGRWR